VTCVRNDISKPVQTVVVQVRMHVVTSDLVALCDIDCGLSSSGALEMCNNNDCDVLFHNIHTSHMIVTDNCDLCSVRSIFSIQPPMF